MLPGSKSVRWGQSLSPLPKLAQDPRQGGRRWCRGEAGKGSLVFLISSKLCLPSPLSVDLKSDSVASAATVPPGPQGSPLTSSTVHQATSPAWMSAMPGSSLGRCSLPRGRSWKGCADMADGKTDWCSACCLFWAKCSEREVGRQCE